MVTDKSTQKLGKIVAVIDAVAPYDADIERQVKAGAIAVVFIRDRSGVPGQTMYVVTGGSQAGLTIPVVEIFQVVADTKQPLSKSIPDQGMEVSLWPEENAWKVANDKTGFQVTMNLFICLWAIIIVGIGILRLNQWWSGPGWRFITIGTVCIGFEIISAALRIALCIVDPFWSFRIISDPAQNILITVNLPFTFAAGILLTFFWAETLKSQRIRASPFISEYRKSAITVIIVLFVAEITTAILRWKLASYSAFNPTWVSQALYAITAIVLTICYIICAVKIREKLREIGGNKKRKIRNMTLRVAGSTFGYLAFTCFLIALIPCLNYPWAFKFLLNGVAISSNFWSTLQVYSFQPPRRRSGASQSSHGTDEGHSVASLKSQKSDFSLAARPRRRPGETDAETDTTDDEDHSSSSSDSEPLHDIEQGTSGNLGKFAQNGGFEPEISGKVDQALPGSWNLAAIPAYPPQESTIVYEDQSGLIAAQKALQAETTQSTLIANSPSNASVQATGASPILIKNPAPILIKNQSRGLSGASISPKAVSFTPRSTTSRTTSSISSSSPSSSSSSESSSESLLITHIKPAEEGQS